MNAWKTYNNRKLVQLQTLAQFEFRFTGNDRSQAFEFMSSEAIILMVVLSGELLMKCCLQKTLKIKELIDKG